MSIVFIPYSLFAVLLLVNSIISQSCDNLDTDVLILGGGMAGVTAANYFHVSTTHSFILIEANERLGGRIKQLEIIPGVFIAEGASFIQGIDPSEFLLHPLMELGNRGECGGLIRGIQVSNAAGVIKVYDSMGNDVTAMFNLRRMNYTAALSMAEEISRLRYGEREPAKPDKTARYGLDKANWVITSSLDNFTEWDGFDSCIAETPDVSSLYGDIELETYKDFRTDDVTNFSFHTDYFVTDSRGYVHLVDCLAQRFRNRVRLNTNVTKIKNMENCVCVTTTTGNLCGKYAILTFSIGVIKSMEFQDNVLTPNFSTQKLEALKVMVMAHYLKIFLVFDRQFWDTNVFFVGYVDENRGYYPLMLTLKDIDPEINVIIFVVTGEMALTVVNQAQDKTQQEIMDVLRTMYGIDIPSPQSIYIGRFSTNPLFRGAFSNIRKGLTHHTFNDLCSPEGRLYFAGEAYSEKYSGFVHGAYKSGIKTAENLSKVLSQMPISNHPGSNPNHPVNNADCFSIKSVLTIDILLVFVHIIL